MQFLFFRQWDALKVFAKEHNVLLIGDIPIYVALDSSDVWANPQEFQLTADLLPTDVAGCPPDGFAADGQLWGNPLFDWDYMKATGFSWWVSRIKYQIEVYDTLKRELKDLPIIAEDLGFLTDSVMELLAKTGFPGMKVLEFAFDSRDTGSGYQPHLYPTNCIVYTGTHDNDTILGWAKTAPSEDVAYAKELAYI